MEVRLALMTEADWEILVEQVLQELAFVKPRIMANDPKKADVLIMLGRHEKETGERMPPKVTLRVF